jgi:hypothetical protein
MKNLNTNSQRFEGMQPLSRAEMKKIIGGVDEPAACSNTVCPAGMGLLVRQIGPGTYECSCQCGPSECV